MKNLLFQDIIYSHPSLTALDWFQKYKSTMWNSTKQGHCLIRIMFQHLICTLILCHRDNKFTMSGIFNTEKMNNYKCRVLINFEAPQQVAIFPHSLILSLFFNVDCTIDLFKKSNICKHWTGILTPNDTQLDCHWQTFRMLLYSFLSHMFLCFWLWLRESKK